MQTRPRSRELTLQDVFAPASPEQLGFSTTAELRPPDGLVGQERAREAIDFALRIANGHYNLYVSGQPGSGRLTTVLKTVREAAAAAARQADDWCYVYNFERPGEPRAIRLSHGAGTAFAHNVHTFVIACTHALRLAFAGERYRRRRQQALKGIEAQHEQLLNQLHEEALAHGFLIQPSPEGLMLIPVKQAKHEAALTAVRSPDADTSTGQESGGIQPLSAEEFASLSPIEQQHVRAEHDAVESVVERITGQLRILEEIARARIREMDHEMAQKAVAQPAADLSARYPGNKAIADFVTHMAVDIAAHGDVLRGTGDTAAVGNDPDQSQGPDLAQADVLSDAPPPADAQEPASEDEAPGLLMFAGAEEGLSERPTLALLRRRYAVNVLVARDTEDGTPVVHEINPTYPNLVGRVEFGLRDGLPYTDHLLVTAGALHRANGGYLVVQAQDLLRHPGAWGALKRVLRFGVIALDEQGEAATFPANASLRPEPIPATIKVVLVGDPVTYTALMELDPEFGELFSVRADFGEDMPRTRDTERFYGQFAGDVARGCGYPPLTADAVACLIEQGSRWAEDQERLSARLRDVQRLTIEACALATAAGDSVVTREQVIRALAQRERRLSLVPDALDSLVERGTIMIDTSGAVVGQVNGLTIMEVGGYVFGKPARITARTAPGLAGIVNIERETMMSGPAHSKGILILGGFLGGRYAFDGPLSLTASICFEQVYGGIEGDSAASAELYAVLSSLAGLPIRQSLAVTGSVNQHGEIQAIGGVNEKIEGFFNVCRRRGLTGEQGVLIPAGNVHNLMLRAEVVDAIREGTFHVYAVTTVDDGIALLTGAPAGEADARGEFPEASVNGRVRHTLRAFLASVRASTPGVPALIRQHAPVTAAEPHHPTPALPGRALWTRLGRRARRATQS